MTLIVQTKLLEAVARWSYNSATPKDRPHLAVVAMLDGELVATDGHRMVRVPVGAPKSLKMAIRREHIFAAAEAQRALRTPVFDEDQRPAMNMVMEGAEIRLVIGGGPVCLTAPAGRIEDYPPIEQVMPKSRASTPPDGYVVNPRYLAAIADIQDVVNGGAERGLRLTRWGAVTNGGMHEPLLFDGYGGTRYVIMPMRDSIGGKP